MKTTLTPLSWATALLLASTAVVAAPDAGGLLREEIRREDASQARPPSEMDVKKQADSNKPLKTTGAKVQVSGYSLSGLSVVTTAQAQEFLAQYSNQTISLDGLHDVAERFEAWLRGKGLFTARAYVPPQDIKDGQVEMRVIEGRLEAVDVKLAPDTRISADYLTRLVTNVLPIGGTLLQDSLERGILLANDLPATSARVVLVPGQELGGSKVLIEAAQGPVVSGNVDLDNTGSRYTGEWRAGGVVQINDPFGRGDQFSARAGVSDGTSLIRVGYLAPIGAEGWKIGLNYIDSRYKLCCAPEVAAIEAEGGATALSTTVSFPLQRSRLENLTLIGSASGRNFLNKTAGVTNSDKKSESLSFGVAGDRSDLVGFAGLGGFTTYGVQLTAGNINLDGSPDKDTDAAGPQTQGGFNKVTLQASHLMRLSKQSALYGAFSAQVAAKNLDSSEKFVLGGVQGVRAYPTGEGSGDTGWILNVEYRYEINNQWNAIGFVDYGSIQQRQTTYTGWDNSNPGVSNNYDLSGAGVSLAWTPVPGRQVMLTVANRLNDNPARDQNGNNSDGRSDATRIWLQSNFTF